MYIFRHIHIGVVVFFLKVINMPPPPIFFFLSLSHTVSRSSATGSSGDEIGKALASVSGDSLVSAPQAVFTSDDFTGLTARVFKV